METCDVGTLETGRPSQPIPHLLPSNPRFVGGLLYPGGHCASTAASPTAATCASPLRQMRQRNRTPRLDTRGRPEAALHEQGVPLVRRLFRRLTMFAGVISRDHGEPWPAHGLNTARWMHVPTAVVTIADLTATQDGVYFHALTPDFPGRGADPLPHVISWAGVLYLEDGHHRVVRAALNGSTTIEARLLVIG